MNNVFLVRVFYTRSHTIIFGWYDNIPLLKWVTYLRKPRTFHDISSRIVKDNSVDLYFPNVFVLNSTCVAPRFRTVLINRWRKNDEISNIKSSRRFNLRGENRFFIIYFCVTYFTINVTRAAFTSFGVHDGPVILDEK